MELLIRSFISVVLNMEFFSNSREIPELYCYFIFNYFGLAHCPIKSEAISKEGAYG